MKSSWPGPCFGKQKLKQNSMSMPSIDPGNIVSMIVTRTKGSGALLLNHKGSLECSRSVLIPVNLMVSNTRCHNVHHMINLIFGVSGSGKTVTETSLGEFYVYMH